MSKIHLKLIIFDIEFSKPISFVNFAGTKHLKSVIPEMKWLNFDD